MKYYMLPVFSVLFIVSAKAADKDSTVYYNLPDSVKAVQFMAEITVQSINAKKVTWAGIRTDAGTLALIAGKTGRKIIFECNGSATVEVTGMHAMAMKKGEIQFKYDWQLNETHKLLISVATDSSDNFSIYSGYVFLPKENKWKLIGTYKITGRWNTIQQPGIFSAPEKKGMHISAGQVWVQRSNGSWKNLKDEKLSPPTINLFGHIDSIQQHQTDSKLVEEAIASGKTDVKEKDGGIYYKMIKEGTGRQVSITDTVIAFYKLTLLNDGSLVSDFKAKPDTFSLKRLIRGWQIGVPLCKVGGIIKLVIPSDLAYSIRTRAAKIPPNSILVFEIEVVEAKSPL